MSRATDTTASSSPSTMQAADRDFIVSSLLPNLPELSPVEVRVVLASLEDAADIMKIAEWQPQKKLVFDDTIILPVQNAMWRYSKQSWDTFQYHTERFCS